MVNIFFPHKAIAPFVDHYVVINNYYEQKEQHVVRARGIPMLVFPFGGITRSRIWHGDNGASYPTEEIKAPALLTSNNVYCTSTFEGTVRFVMIMLKPTGAYYFAKTSMQGLDNNVLLLEDIGVCKPFAELQDRLWDIQNSAEATALIDHWLCRYFTTKCTVGGGDFTPVFDYMVRHPTMLKVHEIAKKFKCTERWIEKQSTAQTGLSPKTWLRLLRFHRVVSTIMREPDAPWMKIVADFNYTDQSHLIRDFKNFTGHPPLQYFTQHGHTELMLRRSDAGINNLFNA